MEPKQRRLARMARMEVDNALRALQEATDRLLLISSHLDNMSSEESGTD